MPKTVPRERRDPVTDFHAEILHNIFARFHGFFLTDSTFQESAQKLNGNQSKTTSICRLSTPKSCIIFTFFSERGKQA